MESERSSLKPIEGANRALRARLSLKDELVLVLLPNRRRACCAGAYRGAQPATAALCFARLERLSYLPRSAARDQPGTHLGQRTDAGSSTWSGYLFDLWLWLPSGRKCHDGHYLSNGVTRHHASTSRGDGAELRA